MPNPFIDVVNQVLPEPQAALLNGILFGVRTAFPKDLYNSLIATGTIHITALSGQNISILARVIGEVTLPLGRKNSILITLGSILGFVLFVGVESTVVRAAIMGSISLLAVYFGRRNWSLLSLILASVTILLIKPEWINTLSFQLSFAATLGIILLGQSEIHKSTVTLMAEIKREFSINLRTTLAAQLFTLPLIIIYFGRISLVSPLTNVLIAPLVTPIMVLGLLTGVGGWLWLPIGQILAWFTWVLLSLLLAFIYITASLPFAAVTF